jgi:aminopeptidase
MPDSRLVRLADILVNHCTRVRAGDLVTIVAEPVAMEAVGAVFERVLRAGGHPSFHAKAESLDALLLRHGSDAQVGHLCPLESFRLERCDVLIVLVHPVEPEYLAGIDPARLAMHQAARRGLMASSMRRAARGAMRYVAAELPTAAGARAAGMSPVEHAELVYRAGFLHLPDPLGAWGELREQSQRAIEWLSARSMLRFVAPASPGDGRGGEGRAHDGTDLVVHVSGRRWLNHSAVSNFPDGEIETGPRGADGVVNFTCPTYFRGRRVEGIRLRFRGGRVVEASAAVGEDHLVALLDQDAGARVMGEIGIGTNDEIGRITGSAFFDEKVRGTFHAACGAGYPETGNANESGLHWDMVCDLRPGAAYAGSPGGTIASDGEVFQRDGVFLREGWPGRG